MISKRRDCRWRKCTTVLHGGVCHRTSTPDKSGIRWRGRRIWRKAWPRKERLEDAMQFNPPHHTGGGERWGELLVKVGVQACLNETLSITTCDNYQMRWQVQTCTQTQCLCATYISRLIIGVTFLKSYFAHHYKGLSPNVYQGAR